MIQQEAYNTFRWKDPNTGEQKFMPRIIRTIGSATLVDLCQKYLKDEGERSVHSSTLFSILSAMPADSQKCFKGNLHILGL